jgi:hypothetical protein
VKRKYRNPPIIEVVCEFQFSSDSPWDLTVPGLVYEQLKETFPRKVQEELLTVRLPSGVSAPPNLVPQLHSEQRMRFVRLDERAFVLLGKHVLSINHLQPYPSWEQYLPLIEQAFTAYQSVARPEGIHRIGLRYINRIAIPESDVQMSDYFVLFPYVQDRDLLKVELATGVSDTSQQLGAFLDFDYFLAQPGAVAPSEALKWVSHGHDVIERSFEACVTERLRNQFDEESLV